MSLACNQNVTWLQNPLFEIFIWKLKINRTFDLDKQSNITFFLVARTRWLKYRYPIKLDFNRVCWQLVNKGVARDTSKNRKRPQLNPPHPLPHPSPVWPAILFFKSGETLPSPYFPCSFCFVMFVSCFLSLLGFFLRFCNFFFWITLRASCVCIRSNVLNNRSSIALTSRDNPINHTVYL